MVTLRLHPPIHWKPLIALGLMFFIVTACSEQRSDRMFQGNYGTGFSSPSDTSGPAGSFSIMEH